MGRFGGFRGGGGGGLTGAGVVAAIKSFFSGAANKLLGTDDNGNVVVFDRIAATGASNRYWKLDASGDFVLAQFDEMAADLASLASTVAVTGSGEQDIAVTAVITNIRIAPSGGNMTLDAVTGMYLGQAINVTLVQDTSDRTLGLAGTTNCVLGHSDALDMAAGSGAIARGLLVGMDDGAGGVTPTFLRVD